MDLARFEEITRVFVYGTLKPGGRYHDAYCGGQVIAVQPAIAYGQLYDLPLGYPAMTFGSALVQGVVLSFAEASILNALDELEGYHQPAACKSRLGQVENEYERLAIEVFMPEQRSLGQVWAYIMAREKVHALGGVLLPKGIWPA